MKKVLIILTATLLLASCSKQEKVQTPQKEALTEQEPQTDQMSFALDFDDLKELGIKTKLDLDFETTGTEQLELSAENQDQNQD